MSSLIKTDVPHLYKDQVGEVINNDNHGYQTYIQRRNALLIKDNQIQTLENRIASLENALQKLLMQGQ